MKPDYFIFPTNDLRKHDEMSEDCWCKPEIVYTDDCKILCVHNSLDGREQYENGYRKPH